MPQHFCLYEYNKVNWILNYLRMISLNLQVFCLGVYKYCIVFFDIFLCKNLTHFPLLPKPTPGNHDLVKLECTLTKDFFTQLQFFCSVGLCQDF